VIGEAEIVAKPDDAGRHELARHQVVNSNRRWATLGLMIANWLMPKI
jgi:hypothetical protein